MRKKKTRMKGVCGFVLSGSTYKKEDKAKW